MLLNNGYMEKVRGGILTCVGVTVMVNFFALFIVFFLK